MVKDRIQDVTEVSAVHAQSHSGLSVSPQCSVGLSGEENRAMALSWNQHNKYVKQIKKLVFYITVCVIEQII